MSIDQNYSILTVTVPAASHDLTTLEMVKNELGITSSDRDAQINSWIRQWSEVAEDYCKREFAQETLSEQFRLHDCNVDFLVLRRRPVVSITSIIEDGVTLTAADYEIDPATAKLTRMSGDFVTTWSGYKITVIYVAGYQLLDDLPRGVERAVIDLVKRSFFGASRDPMVKSETVEGVGSTTLTVGTAPSIDSLPPEVSALLGPHRDILAV